MVLHSSAMDAFQASLSDDQLGKFLEHEYDSDCDQILEEFLSKDQYRLFLKTKKKIDSEKASDVTTAAELSKDVQRNPMDAFLASLTDEQLGMFHAIEFDTDCNDKLEEILNVKQYNLYQKTEEFTQETETELRTETSKSQNKQNKAMEIFKSSLSDDQRREIRAKITNDSDCDDQLMDILTCPQYELYLKAKEENMCYPFSDSMNSTNPAANKTKTDNSNASNVQTKHKTLSVLEPNEMTSVSIKSDMRLLLLGEAGVGKSTVINAFANYSKYSSYEEAKKGKLQVVVPGSFILMDEELNSRTFDLKPQGSYKPQIVNGYRSLTEYQIYASSLGKSISFIDTPGFGSDSDASEEEFGEALRFAKTEIYHAVLILLNPNMARLTSMLEIFLSKALQSCPIDKVYFCFTNSQLTMYRFGETFSTLKNFLKKKSHTILNLAERSFCFENDFFKFLKVMREPDFKLEDFQTRGLKKSWDHSKETMERLLHRIATTIIPTERIEPTEAKYFSDENNRLVDTIAATDSLSKNVYQKTSDSLLDDETKRAVQNVSNRVSTPPPNDDLRRAENSATEIYSESSAPNESHSSHNVNENKDPCCNPKPHYTKKGPIYKVATPVVEPTHNLKKGSLPNLNFQKEANQESYEYGTKSSERNDRRDKDKNYNTGKHPHFDRNIPPRQAVRTNRSKSREREILFEDLPGFVPQPQPKSKNSNYTEYSQRRKQETQSYSYSSVTYHLTTGTCTILKDWKKQKYVEFEVLDEEDRKIIFEQLGQRIYREFILNEYFTSIDVTIGKHSVIIMFYAQTNNNIDNAHAYLCTWLRCWEKIKLLKVDQKYWRSLSPKNQIMFPIPCSAYNDRELSEKRTDLTDKLKTRILGNGTMTNIQSFVSEKSNAAYNKLLDAGTNIMNRAIELGSNTLSPTNYNLKKEVKTYFVFDLERDDEQRVCSKFQNSVYGVDVTIYERNYNTTVRTRWSLCRLLLELVSDNEDNIIYAELQLLRQLEPMMKYFNYYNIPKTHAWRNYSVHEKLKFQRETQVIVEYAINNYNSLRLNSFSEDKLRLAETRLNDMKS